MGQLDELTIASRIAAAAIFGEELMVARPRMLPPTSNRRYRVGRNHLCPCGSLTKFKRCCGANLGGLTKEVRGRYNFAIHVEDPAEAKTYFDRLVDERVAAGILPDEAALAEAQNIRDYAVQFGREAIERVGRLFGPIHFAIRAVRPVRR